MRGPVIAPSPVAINAAMGIGNSAKVLDAALNGQPGQTVFGTDLDTLDNPNVDNRAMTNFWQTVSDIIDGVEAIRAGHSRYLPQFPNESNDDYEHRWKNSKFTNIYRDILENLVSKPFEKEVTLIGEDEKIPNEFLEFIEDVDGTGNHLTTFAQDVFFNGINNALDWIFVDYSQAQPAPDGRAIRTIADERELGVRPFWTHVLAANMLEVRTQIINGRERLTFVRMLEIDQGVTYVRIMRADQTKAAWELYRETVRKPGEPAAGHKYEFVQSGPITIDEIPMVPFITGRRKGRSWQFRAALKDAAELQIELYQSESGLKNLRNLGGFPMLVAQGLKPEMDGKGPNAKPKAVATGPQSVLWAPPIGETSMGDWKFITPSAEIYKFLLEDIKETINQLRELGRNPLTAQSANMTAVTAATAAKKGNSAVQMWAFTLKDALENALVLTGMWFNISKAEYDPQVQVFTDFEVEGHADDVRNLIDMRKNREISLNTFWREMQRRGTLSGEFDPELEREMLLEEMISPESDQDIDDPAESEDDPSRQET